MTLLAPSLVALAAAVLSVPVRKRLWIVGPLTVAALIGALVVALSIDQAAEATAFDLALRATPLQRLLDLILFTLLVLIALSALLVEPVYNAFPVVLFTAAAVHAVLVLTVPLPLFLVLVASLAAPAVALAFRIHENQSLVAAMRHFGSVAVGGSLGIAALALAAQQPSSQGEERLPLTLLLVLLVAAFALLLGALPFHSHLAFLTGEAPVSALAVLFGVLAPLSFVAFLLLLSLSGVLPAVASVAKAQTVLSTLGLLSAAGGALLAVGAPDLRRLVAYSVVSNLGTSLLGLATFSSPGIVGAVGTMLVTGVSATQQLIAVGALGRAALPEDRELLARRAPLAAATFLLGSLAMVGLPPFAGFPARFLVQEIAFAVATPVGATALAVTTALVLAHLRAGLRLFADPPGSWAVEKRPVAAATGFVVLSGLLVSGLAPETYLRPIAEFAREFLFALRPL